MSYGLLDDQLHDDPRFLAAGLAANGLWTRCVCWARSHRDAQGVIPLAAFRRLGGTARLAAVLMRPGVALLQERDGGYYLSGYRAMYAAADERRRERGRVAARSRWRTHESLHEISLADAGDSADSKINSDAQSMLQASTCAGARAQPSPPSSGLRVPGTPSGACDEEPLRSVPGSPRGRNGSTVVSPTDTRKPRVDEADLPFSDPFEPDPEPSQGATGGASRATAVVGEVVLPPTAREAVAAWVEGCRGAGAVADRRTAPRIGREARRLLGEGHAGELVVEGARLLGAENRAVADLGWVVGDLERGLPPRSRVAAASGLSQADRERIAWQESVFARASRPAEATA